MSPAKKTSSQKVRSQKPKTTGKTQAKLFREAAREAGVDPDADVDEVMRRLASQSRSDRSKATVVDRYGGLSAFETETDREARFAEIDRLEGQLKSGGCGNAEAIQRRLCELRGISFDDDD